MALSGVLSGQCVCSVPICFDVLLRFTLMFPNHNISQPLQHVPKFATSCPTIQFTGILWYWGHRKRSYGWGALRSLKLPALCLLLYFCQHHDLAYIYQHKTRVLNERYQKTPRSQQLDVEEEEVCPRCFWWLKDCRVLGNRPFSLFSCLLVCPTGCHVKRTWRSKSQPRTVVTCCFDQQSFIFHVGFVVHKLALGHPSTSVFFLSVSFHQCSTLTFIHLPSTQHNFTK